MRQIIFLITAGFLFARPARSQSETISDSVLQHATLDGCVQYALAHQPSLRQSSLDEEITDRAINSKLADWFPQLNFNANIQHSPQLPTSIVQGNFAKVGLANSSNGQFSLTQTLFNRDVLLASSAAHDERNLVRQMTVSNQIDVVIAVSKAYYAALATHQQIGILDEDILRLERTLKDAYTQYQAGVVDNTDFKRATITLNNVKAQRRQTLNQLKARYASLREQMGYPPDAPLELEADSTQMERESILDTTQTIQFESRIEYQVLQTRKQLQGANLDYARWSFLPSLNAYGNYTLNFQSSEMSQLFNHNYPFSNIGLQLSFPIFESGKRIQEIKQAQLELQRVDFDVIALRNAINTQYTQALANYKSNLNNYMVLKENVELAKEVYHTIQLQYKAGTKTYLELIVAETDLRSAQDNQIDALYQVLASKLDLQKALGNVHY
jgi:outer membrane protein